MSGARVYPNDVLRALYVPPPTILVPVPLNAHARIVIEKRHFEHTETGEAAFAMTNASLIFSMILASCILAVAGKREIHAYYIYFRIANS